MINRLSKLVISILYFIFYRSIKLTLMLFRIKLFGPIIILECHAVKSGQIDKFRKQMDLLIKLAEPVSAAFTGPLKPGQNYASVTFDDGFQSVLKNALPVLQERKIPATLFIPTGYIGKMPGWINNENENYDEIIVTQDQLKELSASMITIGSHCVTHPHLTKLDEVEIKKELFESKKFLEKLLEKKIDLLSFPFGDYNEQVLQLAEEVGYVRVFLNIPKFFASKIDCFVFGRIFVSIDDWPIEYKLKLLGAYQWLPIAIFFKRKLRDFYT